MTTYSVTLEIEHLPEGPYLGTSPDLPGLIVQADTPEEVIRLAPDIARDLIEVMQETGQPLPANSRTNLSAVVPRHSGDMPKGTLGAILKQLGIDRDEFDAA